MAVSDDFLPASGTFSVAAFVEPTNDSPGQNFCPIFAKSNNYVGGNMSWSINVRYVGAVYAGGMVLSSATGAAPFNLVLMPTLQHSQNNLIIGTFSYNSGLNQTTNRGYIRNAVVGGDYGPTITAGKIYSNETNVFVGYYGTGKRFPGVIRQIAYYPNTILTSANATDLWNGTITLSSLNPTMLLDFENLDITTYIKSESNNYLFEVFNTNLLKTANGWRFNIDGGGLVTDTDYLQLLGKDYYVAEILIDNNVEYSTIVNQSQIIKELDVTKYTGNKELKFRIRKVRVT